MLHPVIKWAQRKDRVFLEIQLRDIANEKIELSQTSLSFEGESDKKTYGFTLQFFDSVDKQQSKWTKTGFHLFFALQKKQSESFWPRLTKNKQKNQYIQIDWQKWVDEDDQPQEGNKGLGDFDPSQMQNFGGMGGMGGMPGMGGMGMPGMGMGGMGMPGMGGMGMPGMQGMMGGDQDDQQEQGNLDDLQKEEDVEQPVKQQ